MTRNIFQQYYGNARATKVIYGTILIAAFLITKDHIGENSSLAVAISTFFAAIAIVFAEIYSELLGETIRKNKKLSRTERNAIEKDTFAIISVSILPSIVFLVSYVGLYSTQVAFTISYTLLLIILIVFSFWAVRLSGATTLKALVISIIISVIGIAVVLLKYSLGH